MYNPVFQIRIILIWIRILDTDPGSIIEKIPTSLKKNLNKTIFLKKYARGNKIDSGGGTIDLGGGKCPKTSARFFFCASRVFARTNIQP